MRRRLAFIVTTIAALAAVPGAAHAGFYAGEPVDGPSADIRSVGDVDIARDGTGAVAYVRRDGGVDHIFVSRLAGGVWQAPERVDVGLDAPAATPAVAASDGGRLAVVFIAGGSSFAVVRQAGAPAWGAPQLLASGAADPSVDMSFNGAAYATYTVNGDVARRPDGPHGDDLHPARRRRWTPTRRRSPATAPTAHAWRSPPTAPASRSGARPATSSRGACTAPTRRASCRT